MQLLHTHISYIYTHTHTYDGVINVCVYTHIQYIHTHIYTHMYGRVNPASITHTYIYTHIYIHTHTCTTTMPGDSKLVWSS